METSFIDLHCHPAMKPLGKSFNQEKTRGKNGTKANDEYSIWNYDPPTLADKVTNIATSLTKFRQSDFTSLLKGGADIIFVSLKGLEKGFVMTKLGTGLVGDLVDNLIIGNGKKRIDYIQAMDEYFPDLELEYNFYKQLDGKIQKINGQECMYRIISSMDEIDEEPDPKLKVIYLILTIEGAHVFNSGLQMMGKTANEEEILKNLDKVKKWDKKLFFMGMAHHFYNEQCGHAESLGKLVGVACDQKEGINTGFTRIGMKVLKKLLDDSGNGRVLIDLKHMSVQARKEYYNLLDTEYTSEIIPLIVSHGTVNGLKSPDEMRIENQNTRGRFQEKDINFFDDEIIRIARSRGLFAIQLDERRLASKSELKKTKRKISRTKMLFHKSKLVWNQIQHIAEVLNNNGEYAWEIQSLGSDHDGMVNPLNGFWTSEDIGLLASYLEKHAFNYLNSNESAELKNYNKISAGDIVERFLHDNAYEFLQRHF